MYMIQSKTEQEIAGMEKRKEDLNKE